MGYIFLEQKLWVPLDFLKQSVDSVARKELGYIHSLTPLRRDHHNAYPFHIEWNLGGSIDWGTGWESLSVKTSPKSSLQYKFTIANRGLLECCSLSAEESKIRIKLSYEPLADPAQWQAFLQVFNSPQQQIQEDLEALKDRLEQAYINSLLEILPPLPPQKHLTPLVVPAA